MRLLSVQWVAFGTITLLNGFLLQAGSALAQEDTRITICHATGDVASPWAVMRIDLSMWPDHQAHGDVVVATGATVEACPWVRGAIPSVTVASLPTATVPPVPTLTATVPAVSTATVTIPPFTATLASITLTLEATVTLPALPSATVTATRPSATVPSLTALPMATLPTTGQVLICQPVGGGSYIATVVNSSELQARLNAGAFVATSPQQCPTAGMSSGGSTTTSSMTGSTSASAGTTSSGASGSTVQWGTTSSVTAPVELSASSTVGVTIVSPSAAGEVELPSSSTADVVSLPGGTVPRPESGGIVLPPGTVIRVEVPTGPIEVPLTGLVTGEVAGVTEERAPAPPLAQPIAQPQSQAAAAPAAQSVPQPRTLPSTGDVNPAPLALGMFLMAATGLWMARRGRKS
jgi:LPXTG-motif cell wall-anchored protein